MRYGRKRQRLIFARMRYRGRAFGYGVICGFALFVLALLHVLAFQHLHMWDFIKSLFPSLADNGMGLLFLGPINVYTGLMRSGKSYEVVSEVIVPAIRKGRNVVTNVDGISEEKIHPVGQVKFPHLWPGQIPPGQDMRIVGQSATH